MEYTTRQFMIFATSEAGSVDFEQVLETSAETLRKSVDGTKTFVKWEGSHIPSTIEALTTKEGPYNYSEISAILDGPEWSTPIQVQ